MKLKKLLRLMGDTTYVTLGIDGFPIVTLQSVNIPEEYMNYKVLHIWAGRMVSGDSKINIALEGEKC